MVTMKTEVVEDGGEAEEGVEEEGVGEGVTLLVCLGGRLECGIRKGRKKRMQNMSVNR